MASRMIIPISFKNKEDYDYVKSMPNSSHYIRELVRKDRLKQKENNIEKKVEEILEKKLKMINNSNLEIKDNTKEDLIKDVNEVFNIYDS